MSNCEKPGNWKSLSVRGPVDSLQRGLAPGIGRVYDKNVGIANRFNGTWSLLPKGHEGRLFHPRMIRPVVGGGGPTCLKQTWARVTENRFNRLKERGLERN